MEQDFKDRFFQHMADHSDGKFTKEDMTTFFAFVEENRSVEDEFADHEWFLYHYLSALHIEDKWLDLMVQKFQGDYYAEAINCCTEETQFFEYTPESIPNLIATFIGYERGEDGSIYTDHQFDMLEEILNSNLSKEAKDYVLEASEYYSSEYWNILPEGISCEYGLQVEDENPKELFDINYDCRRPFFAQEVIWNLEKDIQTVLLNVKLKNELNQPSKAERLVSSIDEDAPQPQKRGTSIRQKI